MELSQLYPTMVIGLQTMLGWRSIAPKLRFQVSQIDSADSDIKDQTQSLYSSDKRDFVRNLLFQTG